MKHLWVSEHTFSQWRLARLHFVNAEAPEPLENMLSVFHANYDANRQSVDSLLLTVAIWNLENGPELLSPPGCIVTINDYSNLQLFRDAQCQLTARLNQLSWDGNHH
ncbi:hypothetical protein PI124_g10452 [Phytophthora idaei]|nr:hypothetical protein PI126_g9167 [Phytophthora idaei]KAG3244784.1 hypothetical protein PI124_g10452 [Phytophthora idaei]